jgi:amidase
MGVPGKTRKKQKIAVMLSPISSLQSKWRRDRKIKWRQEQLEAAHATLVTVDSHPLLEDDHLPSLADLQAHTSDGTLPAVALVKHMSDRALESNTRFNCLTEIMIDEAVQTARRLDSAYMPTTIYGPLYGVPVSLKDNIGIQGYDSSVGYSSLAFQPFRQDSVIVRLIRLMGGIPYVKTNVPQTMLSYECSNPVFQRTVNPHNPLLIPGGSSGGEGALIAAGGSLIGVGTDIGGSLRFPAAFCGITSLKPSVGRFPIAGNRSLTPGQEAISAVVGPMARNAKDLKYFVQHLLEHKPWNYDAYVIEKPWTPVELPAKLRVGYYVNDGVLPSSPACQRGVMEVVDKLKEQGHDVVEFHPPNVWEALEIFYGLVSMDGGQKILAPLQGDPMEPSVKSLAFAASLWRPVRWLLTKVLDWLGMPLAALSVRMLRSKSIHEQWDLVTRRNQYRNDFLQAWLEASSDDGREMDVIVCPVHPLPQLKHGVAGLMPYAAVYCILYNVLDLPAGVLPVTTVDKDKDAIPWNKQVLVEEATLHAAYDVEAMHGAPVAVQVVARRLQEEKVLMCMEKFEDMLRAT